MSTLREFSPAGPCITLGEVVKETAKTWQVRDRHGAHVRYGKNDHRHTEPCVSCRDHARTQYPDGYMD